MSDNAASRVRIANRALLKCGQPASYTIDTETQVGGAIDGLWPGVEARAMAIYDWSFCRQTLSPVAHSAAPGNGWRFGFALPGNRVGDPLAVLDQAGQNERYLRDYMIEAGAIYTNVSPVWVRCRVMLDPLYWDEGFAEAFAIGLAADIAVTLLQDEGLSEKLEMMAWGSPREMGAGGLFGKLIALNRAAQPQARKFMDDDPLTNARFA